MNHTFHIPVLGLGYSVDTPLKIARFGISSVVSIVDDELAERMRKFHAEKNGEAYIPISKNEEDSRAKRITAYLNLLNRLVKQQIADLKQQEFTAGTALSQYFEMLPETCALKAKYALMLDLWIFRSKVRHDSARKYASNSGVKYASIPLERLPVIPEQSTPLFQWNKVC